MAAQIRRPYAAEPSAGVAVLARAPFDVEAGLAGGDAPDFTLADARRRAGVAARLGRPEAAAVTFASWCGCRYDLRPGGPGRRSGPTRGSRSLAVALDEDPEAVRPFAEAAPGLTVLIDRDHEVAERYGMVNVPTVVWIDEDGKVARSNDAQFGDDEFVEFHGKESGPHLEALRRWVVDGEAPVEGDAPSGSLTPTRRWRRPGPNAGWPPTCSGRARTTRPSGTSPGPSSSRRSTSRSAADPCRCAARIPSATPSSSSTPSGRRGPAVLPSSSGAPSSLLVRLRRSGSHRALLRLADCAASGGPASLPAVGRRG